MGATAKDTILYFYDLHECIDNPDWEIDKEAMWEMTVEEFQEAFNEGDYSYMNNCIYFFFSNDERMEHITQQTLQSEPFR